MFDKRVQIRDPKSGRVIATNPYRKFVRKEGEFYERPVGSGNLFWDDNTPAGRAIFHTDAAGKVSIKEIQKGAEHVAPVSEKSKADKLVEDLVAKEKKIAELESKLIAKESDAALKTAPTATMSKGTKNGRTAQANN